MVQPSWEGSSFRNHAGISADKRGKQPIERPEEIQELLKRITSSLNEFAKKPVETLGMPTASSVPYILTIGSIVSSLMPGKIEVLNLEK